MEREASGQGGCCGLILPLFVLDVRQSHTGTGVGLLVSDFLGLAASDNAVLSRSVPLASNRQSGSD